MQRKLEELNLIDDFLFFKMLEDEEIGEEFARNLLEIIFGKTFGKLKVIPQKAYCGSDTDQHGVRLDVYLEEVISDSLLEDAIIYDIEPESKSKEKDKSQLPKRMRFYHAKIDTGCLSSGMDYRNLKKVIVVMISAFDPFGYDQILYTIKNTCLEVPELPYEDGAKTLFFYTRGTKGNPSKSLRELLHYMDDTKVENAKNEKLKILHNLVTIVKGNAEVSREYMKWNEIKNMWLEEGHASGLAEGHASGLAEGQGLIIKTARKYGASEQEIISLLMEEFHMSENSARELCKNN